LILLFALPFSPFLFEASSQIDTNSYTRLLLPASPSHPSLPPSFSPDIHLDLTQLPQKTLKGVVHITFACQSPTEGRKIVLDAVAFAELEVGREGGREGGHAGRKGEIHRSQAIKKLILISSFLLSLLGIGR